MISLLHSSPNTTAWRSDVFSLDLKLIQRHILHTREARSKGMRNRACAHQLRSIISSRLLPERSRPLEPASGLDIAQLEALRRLLGALPSGPALAQALVTAERLGLEAVVRGRAGSAEDNNPVLEPAALSEGTEALCLDEFVGVYVLAGRFAAGHEEDVVAHEGGGVGEGQATVDDHGKGDAEVVDGGAERDGLATRVDKDLSEGCAEEIERNERGRGDEGEEVAVVPAANAVIEPDAVMIVRLDTVVAEAAVVSPGRAPDIAGAAVLDGDFHGGGGRLGRFDQRPIISGRALVKRIIVLRWREVMEAPWKNLCFSSVLG